MHNHDSTSLLLKAVVFFARPAALPTRSLYSFILPFSFESVWLLVVRSLSSVVSLSVSFCSRRLSQSPLRLAVRPYSLLTAASCGLVCYVRSARLLRVLAVHIGLKEICFS